MFNARFRVLQSTLPLLFVSTALIGCSSSLLKSSSSSSQASPTPSVASPTTAPSTVAANPLYATTSWTTLLPGEKADGLNFTTDGALEYNSKALLDKIPVTYVSDGSAINAKRLLISPSSPSGNYTFVKGCEEADPNYGLCWAVFLVDKAEGTANPVTVGKYGGKDWVQWSSDDRYAVMVEAMEGSSWIYVVDLETEASKNLGEQQGNVDLDSFKWTGDRTFTVNVNAAPVDVDINTVFDAAS